MLGYKLERNYQNVSWLDSNEDLKQSIKITNVLWTYLKLTKLKEKKKGLGRFNVS